MEVEQKRLRKVNNMARKLLIMPPSYRRRTEPDLPAIERYDGVLYRVLRRNLKSKDVDILVLTEDLKLVWGNEKLPYKKPKGDKWSGYKPQDIPDDTVKKNMEFLKEVLEKGNYDEVFVALGEKFRKAIGDLEKVTNVRVTYIEGRGLGPYAQCLKEWLKKVSIHE